MPKRSTGDARPFQPITHPGFIVSVKRWNELEVMPVGVMPAHSVAPIHERLQLKSHIRIRRTQRDGDHRQRIPQRTGVHFITVRPSDRAIRSAGSRSAKASLMYAINRVCTSSHDASKKGFLWHRLKGYRSCPAWQGVLYPTRRDLRLHFPNNAQNFFSLACCFPFASRRNGASAAMLRMVWLITLSGHHRGRSKSTKRTTR